MKDRFKNFFATILSVPSDAIEITPNDATDLTDVIRGINVGESGSVKVTTYEGNDVTIFVAAGGVFPLRVVRVWAAGTTATGIVGLI
jgi:hypothetical protein